MAKSRPPYPPQFRVEAVRLVRSVQVSIAQAARDLGVSLLVPPVTRTRG